VALHPLRFYRQEREQSLRINRATSECVALGVSPRNPRSHRKLASLCHCGLSLFRLDGLKNGHSRNHTDACEHEDSSVGPEKVSESSCKS